MCPGRRFARNEIKAVVAVLLRTFHLEIMPDTDRATANPPVSVGDDPLLPLPLSHPGYNGARAGLGIFPPKREVLLKIEKKLDHVTF